VSATIIKDPSIAVSEEVKKQLLTETEEIGQVILHIIYKAPSNFLYALIRIWPTSYLYDHHSDHRSELVHAENITFYPEWHQCNPGIDNYFTLIFSGLPASCKMFDFIELCDGSSGAFEVHNIPRNNTDVYYISL
jgi:hypothetical protein